MTTISEHIKDIMLSWTIPSSTGQTVRVACTIMGMFAVILAYQLARVIGGLTWLLTGQDMIQFGFEPSWGRAVGDVVILLVVFGIVWWCGHHIKKNDVPRPEGWGKISAEKSDPTDQPDVVWIIKRVWEAGYIREGEGMYFATIRDIIKQAGVTVSSTQIRSALEIAGCRVSRDRVQERELTRLFNSLEDGEPTVAIEV